MRHRRGSPPFSPTLPVYPFHDRRDRDHFLDLVRKHLGRDGGNVVIENGVARVEGEDGLHGLTNIAQVCHRAPRDAWPRLVAEHLAKSDRPKLTAFVEGVVGSAFDEVASQLAVRIHPEEYLAGSEQHLVQRTDLPGTVTVLVLDLGPSTLAVPVPLAETWGVPIAALFDAALKNLARQTSARWLSLPLPPDGARTIDAFAGDFFASSHVLRTDAFLPRTGRYGNLFGLPTRGGMISYPLDALPFLPAIEAMVFMANGMFREGPGSITPHLYWRTPDGKFLLQQGCCERGKVRFAPSPEFADLMARMQADRA